MPALRSDLTALAPCLVFLLVLAGGISVSPHLGGDLVRGARAFSADWWDGALVTSATYESRALSGGTVPMLPLNDQPEGVAAILSAFFPFFEAFAPALLSALSQALAVSLLFLALRASLPPGRRALGPAALGFSLLAVSCYIHPLTAYDLVLPVSFAFVALFALLLIRIWSGAPGRGGALLGMASAVLVGLRHELVLIVLPPFLLLLLPPRMRRDGIRALALFVALSCVWAGWHWLNFGQPFAHESQAGRSVAEAMYRQCLGPVCFRFNGLLNFQGKIVRTPGYSYPVFLFLPLAIAKDLGILLSALTLTGLAAAFAHPNRALASLALSAALFLALFLPMENWTTNKTAVAFCFLPLLILLAFLGMSDLLSGGAAAVPRFLVSLLLVLSFLSAISGMAYAFPEDGRWYARFSGFPSFLSVRFAEGALLPSDVSLLPSLSQFPAGQPPPALSFSEFCGGLPPFLKDRTASFMVLDESAPPSILLCGKGDTLGQKADRLEPYLDAYLSVSREIYLVSQDASPRIGRIIIGDSWNFSFDGTDLFAHRLLLPPPPAGGP